MNGIRRAGEDDVAALARVHVACWHESYDGLVPAAILGAFSVARGEAVWRRILSEPAAFNGAHVVVAELDQQLVGFGSCCSQRSAELAAAGYDGEVSSIYLLREFQRRGLGLRLMHVLAAELLGRGCGSLSLWVLRDNARARAFYERCGGRVVAERTDVRENTPLPEVAYGWPSLRALRDLTGGSETPRAPHSNG